MYSRHAKTNIDKNQKTTGKAGEDVEQDTLLSIVDRNKNCWGHSGNQP